MCVEKQIYKYVCVCVSVCVSVYASLSLNIAVTTVLRVCVCLAVTRKEYQLIGVSSDGYASLLDVTTGAIDTSLQLPPVESLRHNTAEESAQYAALVDAVQRGDDVVNVVVLGAMGKAAIQPVPAASA